MARDWLHFANTLPLLVAYTLQFCRTRLHFYMNSGSHESMVRFTPDLENEPIDDWWQKPNNEQRTSVLAEATRLPTVIVVFTIRKSSPLTTPSQPCKLFVLWNCSHCSGSVIDDVQRLRYARRTPQSIQRSITRITGDEKGQERMRLLKASNTLRNLQSHNGACWATDISVN